jgi:hypothetical protein
MMDFDTLFILVQCLAIQALYFQVRNKIRTRIKNRPAFKDERFQDNLLKTKKFDSSHILSVK